MSATTVVPAVGGDGTRGRAPLLVAASVLLMAGFVVVPRLLAPLGADRGYAGSDELAHAAQVGFVTYWQSGDAQLPPSLSAVVEYWQHYHVVKAVIAVLLAAVFITIATVAWRAASRPRSVWTLLGTGAGAVAASIGGLFSIALVMANVQGAVAPFASLLPMIASGSEPELSAVMDQARNALADGVRADVPPAMTAMVDGVSSFHIVLAVLAALVALGLVAGAVILWRRRRSADRAVRRVLTGLSIAAVLVSMGFTVLVLANLSTAARPEIALLQLLAGSW